MWRAQVQAAQEQFQDGEYVTCQRTVWKARVELEALKNMIAAVR